MLRLHEPRTSEGNTNCQYCLFTSWARILSINAWCLNSNVDQSQIVSMFQLPIQINMVPQIKPTQNRSQTRNWANHHKIRSYFQMKLLNQSFICEFHFRCVSTSNSYDVDDLLRKHRISVVTDKDWLKVNFTKHWFHWSGKITLTDIIEPDITVYCWREILNLADL